MNTLALAVVVAAYTVQRRAPPAVRSPASLDALLSCADFTSYFRLTPAEYIRIFTALQLPGFIVTEERDSMAADVALLMLLGYLGGSRLPTLADRLGRSEAACSRICTTLITLIDATWSHLLDVKSAHRETLAPARLAVYAQKLAAHGCPLPNLWGFIDGTVRPTARPIRSQREFYSGHKRQHGFKYQVVVAPDGIMWVYGPVAARRNDAFVLQDSGLHAWLDDNSKGPNGEDMFIFGDKGYAARGHLVVPYKGLYLNASQTAFNLRMSRVRIAVEWAIGSVPTLFPRLNTKREQRTLRSDLGAQYRVAVLLRNALTCVSGNQTGHTFDCRAPSLSAYFVTPSLM